MTQQDQEPVQWGVDWGRVGETPCVSIIKRKPDGNIEVVAVEYGPARKPLTEEQLREIWYSTESVMGWYSFYEIARLIEAAHEVK